MVADKQSTNQQKDINSSDDIDIGEELNIEKSNKTHKIDDIANDIIASDKSIKGDVIAGPCLFLYLPEAQDPIEIRNITVVTFGRQSDYSDEQPMIDLSKHHAKLLGVSRLHAEIIYHNDNYYVRDCDSTNGTWVNQEQVSGEQQVRLETGDTIRLGHLVIQVGGL